MWVRPQLRLLVILVLAAASVSAQSIDSSFAEEIRRMDDEIEIRSRALRAPESGESLRAALEEYALSAELSVTFPEISEPRPLELASGRQAPAAMVHVDFSGRDQYSDLSRFLHVLGDMRVAIDTLSVTADGYDAVTYAGRLTVLYRWDVPKVLPPAEEAVARGFLRIQSEKMEHLEFIVEHVLKDENAWRLAYGIEAFTSRIEEWPVALTEMSLGESLTIKGVVAGATARELLRKSMEASGLNVQSYEVSSQDMCRWFVARVALPPLSKEPPPAVIRNGPFDSGAASTCRADAVGQKTTLAITGEASPGVTAKLLGVDLAAVFEVLHDVTGENFVLSSDVKGVVDVDLRGASPAEVLDALRRKGLKIGDPPLRHVSARGIAPDDYTPAGEPLAVSLTNADLRDVLCTFSRITELEIYGAALDGHRVSTFAEVEWDRLLVSILRTAGFDYRLEGNRATVFPIEGAAAGTPANVCEMADQIAGKGMNIGFGDIEPSDLQISGVARVKDGWRAYMYLPGRTLGGFGPGHQIFGGTIQSVGPDGVVIATADGDTQLGLRPH